MHKLCRHVLTSTKLSNLYSNGSVNSSVLASPALRNCKILTASSVEARVRARNSLGIQNVHGVSEFKGSGRAPFDCLMQLISFDSPYYIVCCQYKVETK